MSIVRTCFHENEKRTAIFALAILGKICYTVTYDSKIVFLNKGKTKIALYAVPLQSDCFAAEGRYMGIRT